MPKKHHVRNLEGDGGDTVTTIVAAVRTFHSKTKQDNAALAVASARVLMMVMLMMVMMTADGIPEMPMPATKVFDHLQRRGNH